MSLITETKKIIPPFLQKCEFQNQGNSILMGLFGNISMLILQNDMTQEICFRENKHFVPWDKKRYSNIYFLKTGKIVVSFKFLSKFFETFQQTDNFLLKFLFRFFRRMGNFFSNLWKIVNRWNVQLHWKRDFFWEEKLR